MNSDVKAAVRRRAHNRCEYCRIPVRFDALFGQVEHIIAKQHGGKSELQNLAWSCRHCNAHKGPNVAGVDPKTAQTVRLFNPRHDRWNDHFRWMGARLIGQTAEGRTTIYVLAINQPVRIFSRQALMDEGKY